MAKHHVSGSKRAGEAGLGRTENGDHWNAEERGEMHGAGVVGEQ